MKIYALFFLSLLVVSCGGGGSSGQEDQPPEQPQPPAENLVNHKKFWVSEDGNCQGEDPCFSRIIDALDASFYSFNRDSSQIHEVYVFPGTYISDEDEVPVILLWHPVKLIGIEGPDFTVITGYNNGACAEIADPGYVLIQGFTFSECGRFDTPFVNERAAIYSNSSYDMDLHVVGNVFENNGKLPGVEGYVLDLNPWVVNFENINLRVERNIIRNNWGGIRLDVNYKRVEDGLISRFIIANNLIYNNSAPQGKEYGCATVCLNSFATPDGDKVEVDILNNTIFNNTSGILASDSSDAVRIENNIIQKNGDIRPQVPWHEKGWNGVNPTVIRNNVLEEHADDAEHVKNNNIYGDPLFYDEYSGDFRLIQGSAGIDLKESDPRVVLETDFLGEARVVDGDYDGIAEIDAGAIEFRP